MFAKIIVYEIDMGNEVRANTRFITRNHLGKSDICDRLLRVSYKEGELVKYKSLYSTLEGLIGPYYTILPGRCQPLFPNESFLQVKIMRALLILTMRSTLT